MSTVTAPRRDSSPIVVYVTFALASIVALVSATLALAAFLSPLISDDVRVNMPTQSFWPPLLPTVVLQPPPAAHVSSGGYEVAPVTVAGLSMDARVQLAFGGALQGLTFAALAAVLAVICIQLLRGAPFQRIVVRALNLSAAIVIIGGLGSQLLLGFGGVAASMQVLTVDAWQADRAIVGIGQDFIGWPYPQTEFHVDFWPIFVGLALLALAAVFHAGARLQRDTEGLV